VKQVWLGWKHVHLYVHFASGLDGSGRSGTAESEVGFLRELDGWLDLDVESVAAGIGHRHRLTHLHNLPQYHTAHLLIATATTRPPTAETTHRTTDNVRGIETGIERAITGLGSIRYEREYLRALKSWLLARLI